MALTRKMLASMGIDEEKADQIIEAHAETVSALKDERDRFREEAEALPAVRQELEELKARGDGGYREKYEREHADFEAFKAEAERAEADREKSRLYRALLQDAGVDPRRIDSIMRVADLSEVAVEDGKLADADGLADAVREEWSDFIVQTGARPAPVDDPPAGSNDPNDKEPGSLAEALRQKYAAQSASND